MLEQDEHRDLCDSGHRSIILYVYRRCCIAVCVTLFKAELNLCRVEVKRTCLLLSSARHFIAQGHTVTL
jgi:hypothetical protein